MRRAFRVVIFVALVSVPRAAWPQGNPLGPEFQVNTYITSDQVIPSVGAGASGNFVVVWTSDGQDGSYMGVFGQRYASSGIPLGAEFRVNTYTTAAQRDPSVTAYGSGNIVVVWGSSGQDESYFGVFGQRYASSGAPVGPEFRVNTYTTGGQGFPSVAADTSGNFVVVWTSVPQDGSDFGIFGQRFTSSGTPLGPEFRVNTYTSSFQHSPVVASDASGNFVVVWQSYGQDGSHNGVFGQRYSSSGAPLGPEFRVNTYTTGGQRESSVTTDGSGNFVVVWASLEQDGWDFGIFGQRYASSGAPVGPEFRVNTDTSYTQVRPSVAADTLGNFVVVWTSGQDGSYWGVFGQRYASSGVPSGPEFRINAYTTSFQSDPSVASDSSGNFVVVWQSRGQDGSSYGLFGQRYGGIFPVELMHFRVE